MLSGHSLERYFLGSGIKAIGEVFSSVSQILNEFLEMLG